MLIEAQRCREVRLDLNLSQKAFADKLEYKNVIADIEGQRTKMPGVLVMQFLKILNINPLWLYGESDQKYLNPHEGSIAPKLITVDNDGNENILLVSQKAAAGYAGNVSNENYYQSLPAFTFPLPEYRNASFRGFQIEGDSMMPAVHPGDWILAQAVEKLSDIKNGNIYIIVENDGVRLKKVQNDADNKMLILISLNPEYQIEQTKYQDIAEVWKFHSKIGFDLEEATSLQKLEDIHNDILEIKQGVLRNR